MNSITIPQSVTTLEPYVFEGCTGKLIFNCNLTNPNSYGLFESSSFDEIIIGESVTVISNNTFENMKSVTRVTIGSNVESIGGGAFYGCDNIAEVHISDIAKWCSIHHTDEYSNPLCYGQLFYNNSLVSNLVVPNGITSISDYAFHKYNSLIEVTIPNSVNSIGNNSFKGCANLMSVSISDGTTLIGASAFSECNSLTSISIPDSVTELGDSAFYGCDELKTVYCQSNTPPNLGTKVFDGNASERVIYVPNGTIESYHSATNWKDYKAYIMYEGEQPLKVGDVVTKGGATGVVFSISQSTVKLVSTTETNNKRSSAVSWCNNYGTGWRMPTYSELSSIYYNKAKLNTNLSTKLGTGYYWTSENHGSYSYSVKVLNFTNGVSAYENENKSCYARAVFEF